MFAECSRRLVGRESNPSLFAKHIRDAEVYKCVCGLHLRTCRFMFDWAALPFFCFEVMQLAHSCQVLPGSPSGFANLSGADQLSKQNATWMLQVRATISEEIRFGYIGDGQGIKCLYILSCRAQPQNFSFSTWGPLWKSANVSISESFL